MTVIAQSFNYLAPTSQDELLALLADNDNVKLVAGGTDLLIELRLGISRPKLVVDIKKVAGYRDVRWEEGVGLHIGSAATINELLRNKDVQELFPLLVACGVDLASHQIRNRATVVGNIVNASPCADMAPGLLCHKAGVVIASRADGERTVPMEEFFTGVKKTILRKDEVVAGLVIPPETAGARGDFRKLKRIKGHDLGIIGVAVYKKDGAVRLGISSAYPTPLLIEGLREDDPIEKIVEEAGTRIKPISDVRCTAEYRTHMVRVYTRRLMEEVA